MDCAIAIYKGSGKRFFIQLAEQLGIETTEPKLNKDGEEVGERNLTLDELKEAIASDIDAANTLLIFPEARRLTTGIRYWLEDLICEGATVCCFAPANPGRDIFLRMIEIELELPSDRLIREEMKREANRQGLTLNDSKLAELQSYAGRNPMLARKIIRNEKLGLSHKAQPQHTQYIDISPIIISSLMCLGIVRFIGMGTGNKGLYIIGGVALIAGMMLKQIGQIRGARKRLGQ
ncbi:MAG: hypothetical protein F6K45_23095 [Kamptonema sp. SIO1D9]|nr:hypothetical protein [Kamptonema sp. SIO1D9]